MQVRAGGRIAQCRKAFAYPVRVGNAGVDALRHVFRPVVSLQFIVQGKDQPASNADFESVVIGDDCDLGPPVRSPLSPSCNAANHGFHLG